MSLNHYPFPTTCLLLSAFQSDTTFFIILAKIGNKIESKSGKAKKGRIKKGESGGILQTQTRQNQVFFPHKRACSYNL